MSDQNNASEPELVIAKIGETHKQLVPVYIKEPEKSLIDSALVKWGSKIMLGFMSMVVVPIVLTTGYHAYDKLENHSTTLAVVVENQEQMKEVVSNLDKKFDSVVAQVNDAKNDIVALNQEVADMKAVSSRPIIVPDSAPAPIIERAPPWHPHHAAPDPTPPIIKALEKAIDPRHHH
jgi:hypothetical protein